MAEMPDKIMSAVMKYWKSAKGGKLSVYCSWFVAFILTVILSRHFFLGMHTDAATLLT